MNIKPIVVKSYLESLTEERELNKIFPILLTSMGFEILTKTTENKGLPEYGKDVVAVGKDADGIKKRVYFELKGGKDKDITSNVLNKNDGIIESLRESKYARFETTYKGFSKLPKKVVLVHNGELKGSARKTYKDFVEYEFPEDGDIEFDRWDIERLSLEFSEHLFSVYLLVDPKTTKIFNKVLINLNVSNHISSDFFELIDYLFNKNSWLGYKRKLQRKWVLLFETFKLISFIIYTEAKEYNNLDIAKRYLTHLIIKFWYWILKNKLEDDVKVLEYFDTILKFYLSVITEYFQRTLPIARIHNGLSRIDAGRYEEIGYTKRTFEYLEYLTFILDIDCQNPKSDKEIIKTILTDVINSNSVSFRPLIDINSIAITNVINLYIRLGDTDSARTYLKGVLGYFMHGKEKYGRIPDASNNYENVVRFTVTGKKPIYYSDSTSPLLAVLLEYTAILDLEKDYKDIQQFIKDYEIDLGIFVPHHGLNSSSRHLIENKEEDLEEQLFSNPSFNDGYQKNIDLTMNLQDDTSFKDFKKEFSKSITEFEYEYRTDKAGYAYLRKLAHTYHQIPYFPDEWRKLEIKKTNETT